MSQIYLIRHGEIHNPRGLFYGRSVDVELDAIGKKQIERLGRTIKHHGDNPQILLTSPMKRTRQTSEILSEIFGNVPVIQSDDLQEVDSSGFEGWRIKKLLAQKDVYNSPPPGIQIESINKVAQRMLRAIRTAGQKYKGKRIGFVSHGDPIAITRWALAFPDMPNVPSREILKFSPAKGEAWKLQVYPDGSYGNYELIRGEAP